MAYKGPSQQAKSTFFEQQFLKLHVLDVEAFHPGADLRVQVIEERLVQRLGEDQVEHRLQPKFGANLVGTSQDSVREREGGREGGRGRAHARERTYRRARYATQKRKSANTWHNHVARGPAEAAGQSPSQTKAVKSNQIKSNPARKRTTLTRHSLSIPHSSSFLDLRASIVAKDWHKIVGTRWPNAPPNGRRSAGNAMPT